MKIVKKINLTSAQLIASFAAPIEILAAPTAGTANSVLSITGSMHRVAPSFDNAPLGWIAYQPALAQGVFVSSGIIDANNDNERPFYQSQSSSMVFTTESALMFQLSSLPTVGAGNLDIYIVYENNPVT